MTRKQGRKKRPTRSAGEQIPRLDLDILPTLLGFNIRRAQIALWRDFARTVAGGEIRPGMFSAIALIRANPGIAQVDLANELGIDKASMVGLIDRLEDAGWIVRKRSQEDRRRQGVSATAAGERTYRSLRREMLDHERKFVAKFSDAERNQLITLLRRLHRAVEDK